MKRSTMIVLGILFLAQSTAVLGQQKKTEKIELKYGSHRIGKRDDAIMERWRSYGLGQFIHWGLYAIPGGEWNGKQYNGAAEWIRSWNGIPKSTYDSLIYKFDPIKFDAKQWAAEAKQMGAKYVIFTTKHHDGFCMWPSKYTNYTIKNSPFKKDVVKEVVDAYDSQGIDVYLYFSIIDWNHPGYQAGNAKPNPFTIESWKTYNPFSSKEKKDKYEEFKKFTRNQLVELLTNYPKAKGLWFDGTWDPAWMKQDGFTDSLEKELRALRPGLIIGSRFRADENGSRHFDSNGDLMGDYEQGWERKLPNKIEDVHGNDWDCVMTVPENQWGYNKAWKGHIKTSNELIEMTAKSVSLGGNFVLNFGPTGDGSIRPEEKKLASEIGNWMKTNGEAIYSSTYAGLEKQDWGYFTKKKGADKINMIIFNTPVSGAYRVKLPAGTAIAKSYQLASPSETLKVEEIHANEYFIHLNKAIGATPFVIVLETTKKVRNGDNNYEKAKT
ncbi:alpha-L-fucosidase [Pedobacter frigoris]|uniref:alpha-L-fucosidase n=1 Tax=Pedobacter frigoris TaxID=2571272 RepID=UPI002931B1F3|nr:alpha-L-fucosidase [Pedobacter frigoris]